MLKTTDLIYLLAGRLTEEKSIPNEVRAEASKVLFRMADFLHLRFVHFQMKPSGQHLWLEEVPPDCKDTVNAAFNRALGHNPGSLDLFEDNDEYSSTITLENDPNARVSASDAITNGQGYAVHFQPKEGHAIRVYAGNDLLEKVAKLPGLSLKTVLALHGYDKESIQATLLREGYPDHRAKIGELDAISIADIPGEARVVMQPPTLGDQIAVLLRS